MKNKIIMAILFLIVLAIFVFASISQESDTVAINSSEGEPNLIKYEINQFSDGVTEINVSNAEYTFAIPMYANVTYSVLNISSLNGWYFENDSESSHGYSGSFGADPTYAWNEEWDTTYVYCTDSDGCSLYENTSFDYHYGEFLWYVKVTVPISGMIDIYCWNNTNSDWSSFFNITSAGTKMYLNKSVPDDCVYDYDDGKFVLQIKTNMPNSAMTHYYEGKSIFTEYNYNITLDFGDDGVIEFNHSGDYKAIDNQTIDVASEFNKFIKRCYLQFMNQTIFSRQNNTNVNYSTGNWYVGYEPSYLTDMDWSTQSRGSAYLSVIYFNFTKDKNATSAILMMGDENGLGNVTVPSDCYNYYDDVLSFAVRSSGGIVIPQPGRVLWVCYDGQNHSGEMDYGSIGWPPQVGWDTMRHSPDPSGDGYVNESAIFWSNESSDYDVDNNNTCDVILNISAVGYVQLDAINITYEYNVSHAFSENNSLSWNVTGDVAVNTELKRRYSIEPTSDLLSENVSLTGYEVRNGSATECEVNNIARTVVSGYCSYADNFSKGGYWSLTHIWDNNITDEVAANMTNTEWMVSTDAVSRNDTLAYYDAELATASSGLLTNVTVEYYYNSSITQNEKLEFFSGGQWYDITPSSPQDDCVTSPTYEKKTANGRTFYVCLSTSQQYVSYKVASNG
jgi:hypothetical protein